MKFKVMDKWQETVQFIAEIKCEETTDSSIKLGLAVKWAHKNNANLNNANLSGANLYNANLNNATIIETGETWKEYLEQTVLGLIAAGGHPVSKEAWKCHTWNNCPMAESFAVERLEDVPILFRPRVAQFIRYFGSGLIPATVGLGERVSKIVGADNKFDTFMSELRALCIKHKIMICAEMYDLIQVWDLKHPEEPIDMDRFQDKTGLDRQKGR